MNPARNLPENYIFAAGFTLKARKMLVLMNFGSLLLLFFSGWLFTRLAILLRQDDAAVFLTLEWDGISAVLTLLIALLIIFATTIVHEAFHGLAFYFLTKAKPVFAFRGAYAYAAAPEWYIPRNPYLFTALAPLIGISLLGLALIAVVPPTWIAPLVLACVVNASGAVGDLWVAGMLLRQPPAALANDRGDEIKIFVPA